MLEADLLIVATLTAVGIIAGFIDAIAGGGGLLTIPALLSAGLDPLSALATNKLQSSFGSFSAALTYSRAGKVYWNQVWLMLLISFLGATAGAFFIKAIPSDVLAAVMPLLLIAVAAYFITSRQLPTSERPARMSSNVFTFTVALGISFYDGCFGPGTGSFFMIGFVLFLGFPIMHAVAHTKLLNFSSNLGALIFFAFNGGIHVLIGISMGIGQYAGARLGAHIALRNGAKVVRPLLVIISCTMAVRLLLDSNTPLRNFLGYIFKLATLNG